MSFADEFCNVDFLETLIGLDLGPHAGDLLGSKFDAVSCRHPDYVARQVVAGAHSGPRIGTGRQENTVIKFDGMRRFQRDLGGFFEWHQAPALIWWRLARPRWCRPTDLCRKMRGTAISRCSVSSVSSDRSRQLPPMRQFCSASFLICRRRVNLPSTCGPHRMLDGLSNVRFGSLADICTA